MDKKRIIWIDILKGILILSVLFLHNDRNNIYPIVNNYFTSFHMALFFALSGYTFVIKNNEKKIICNKISRLLIPCIIWSCISFFEEQLGEILQGKSINIDFLGILTGRSFFDWFLLTLFIVYIIQIFLLKINKNKFDKGYYFINIFLLIVGFILLSLNIPSYYCFIHSLIACGFFSLGVLYRNEIESNKKIEWFYGVFFILIGLLLASINIPTHFSRLVFGNYILGISCRYISILGYFILFSKLSYLNSSKNIINKFLAYYGKNSIIVYLTHFSYILMYRTISMLIIHDKYNYPILLAYVILIVLELPTIIILKKYLPFLVGERKKK